MLLSYGYKNVCVHSFTDTPYTKTNNTVHNFDFAESELRREIETALLRNEDIYSMSGFSAEKVGATLKISFTLNTAYGKSAEVYTI